MKVLVLDDDDERHALFAKRLTNHDVTHVRTFRECVDALRDHSRFDLVYLDHDLNDHAPYRSLLGGMYGTTELTGEDVVRFIVFTMPQDKRPAQCIIHSWNPTGAHRMLMLLIENSVPAIRDPFSFAE